MFSVCQQAAHCSESGFFVQALFISTGAATLVMSIYENDWYSSIYSNQPPITYRPSPITHRLSPIAHRPSPITHHPSPIAYCPLPIAHCPLGGHKGPPLPPTADCSSNPYSGGSHVQLNV
ncbi:hypothetical protein [Desulfatirhabdium butyrativorans]|uniref:hypothetical protein n=1 Tax=Desulfatirhabdium butyrativorans TaxID=340467 RepID=UPI0012EC5B81|nr:hypothetical protein [Desulfatirhabdium butyrativorans]